MTNERCVSEEIFARIGLLGNPSDGFYGKTMACTISNFFATVKITQLPDTNQIKFIPKPLMDNIHFNSLEHLEERVGVLGYGGALRLMVATLKKFKELADSKNWKLQNIGYTVEYSTNIPRQVGLSGSSALIAAFFRCLLKIYEIPEECIPSMEEQPSFILSVETEELGINAGLMDRVAQTFGGMVYMDFSGLKPSTDSALSQDSRNINQGKYFPLDQSLIGFLNKSSEFSFFLAFKNCDGDSGKVHSDIKNRFLSGDDEVQEAMGSFASFSERGRKIFNEIIDSLNENLSSERVKALMQEFGKVMDSNFDLRRKIYGDAVIGEDNLRLIEIGRSLGAHCKFSGSGGAVVGLLLEPENLDKLKQKYESFNFNFVSCIFCSNDEKRD